MVTISPLVLMHWNLMVSPSVQVTVPVTPCRVIGFSNFVNVSKSSLCVVQEQEHPVSTMKEKAPLSKLSFSWRSFATKSLNVSNSGAGDLESFFTYKFP